MDRNRDARRPAVAGSNGFNRRRHRMSSLRDSPDEDGGLELQESVRLRERVKKDRDRDSERDGERERERDLRERSNRSKRRRAERLTNNRSDIAGDESSDESDNDDEDEEHAAAVVGSGVRLLAPSVGSISDHHGGGLKNHQHSSNFGQNINIVSNNHQLQHRKTFPPGSTASKVSRSPSVWKPGDEMIGVSVPRKARSASTKRSNDWISSSSNNNSGGAASGREQAFRQDSGSPAIHGSVPSPSAAAPVSPTSNAKKLKTNANTAGGPKPKPPKASSKPNSSNPEELEIEIAEVLYGLMTQSHGPSSKKEETREANRSTVDTKSRNSSPISNSSNPSYPSMGAHSNALSIVAPKRKRPRQVPDSFSYGNRSCPTADQQVKAEVSSPPEKGNSENGNEMGGVSLDSHELLETKPLESSKMDSDFRESAKERVDFAGKIEASSSAKEKEDSLATREEGVVKDSQSTTILAAAEKENPKDSKFQIDLMAPPPQMRSSPERESPDGSMASAVNPKLVLSMDSTAPRKVKEYAEADEETAKEPMEAGDSQKRVDDKVRVIDLQLDLEKSERKANSVRHKSLQNTTSKQTQQQMQFKASKEEDKSGPSAVAVPLPLSMASWPSGAPPVGYMAPLQGVLSMDGSSVAQPHLQPLMSQPRPKRCATHCHIARNIQFLQQFMKMNPFWAGSPGAASLFGSKSCNVNPIPASDQQGGNLSLRTAPAAAAAAAAAAYNNSVDKGNSVSSVPNNGKEKTGQAAGSSAQVDSRKQQILIQQALPPVAAGSLLGPAFIFPLNQQPPPGVAGARPPAAKSSAPNGPPSAPSSASATMSFSYPNMAAANESQYLAILPNNAYPFPVPVVGAPPNYRGAPPQGMQLFHGSSFYSSQMILPSQMQQPPSAHVAQLLQAQPSAAASNSSLSQKLVPSQQSRSTNESVSSGTGSMNLHNFGSQKNPPSQQLQQSHNPYAQPQRPRNPEGEDGRAARGLLNMYGQNLGVQPMHPQNFTLMPAAPSPPLGGGAAAVSSTSRQMEKKGYQGQQQGLKAGAESLPPSFAMSFSGSINGATASQAEMRAAASVATQVAQNSFQIWEDGKSAGFDSSANGDDRKNAAAKAHGAGHSIAFARSELPDSVAVAPVQASTVNESSSRSPVLSSANHNSSRPMGSVSVSNANIQSQIQQQQEHQRLSTAPVNRSKGPMTSNGGGYSDLSSSPSKFRSGLSGFGLQNQVQSRSGSPNHQQQSHWKNSLKTSTSQAPSSLAPPPSVAALKNLPQQHARASQPPVLTQISFGGNQKGLSAGQGQAAPGTNQPPPSSTPMMVGSPTASNVSKGASGSPRMATSALTGCKIGQTTMPSVQPSKNPPSITTQKSASVAGSLQMASSGNSGGKKYAQLVFPNPYMQSQSQSQHSTSTNSATSSPGAGGHISHRRSDNQQTPPPSTSGSMPGGVLSLNPPFAGAVTSDPAKAIVANAKGGGSQSHGRLNASQYPAQSTGTVLPAGFSYLHPVPAAVPVKPNDQKQPPA